MLKYVEQYIFLTEGTVVKIVLKNKGLRNGCSSTKRAWHICVCLTFYLYFSFLLKQSMFSRTFNFFCL